MMNETAQNADLCAAVHDLVAARPDTVRGRIVFVIDDLDDEQMRRVIESSGAVDTDFLTNFISAVAEHFATVMKESGMQPSVAGVLLQNAASSGVVNAFCKSTD